jgi:hypothetical protein
MMMAAAVIATRMRSPTCQHNLNTVGQLRKPVAKKNEDIAWKVS